MSYAESVQGRGIGRWEVKDLEEDHLMFEVLMAVREAIALQVGSADPVVLLASKLEEKFPPGWRHPDLDFQSDVRGAINKGFVIFDEEYGVLQLAKAAEKTFDKLIIIESSDGSSRIINSRTEERKKGETPPPLYSWYMGNLM